MTPGALKLTSAALGAAHPQLESVSLLAREAANLTRHRIEFQAFPGVLQPETGDPLLFLDEPDVGPRGGIFQQRSTADALDWYDIIIEPGAGATSTWTVLANSLHATNTQSGQASPAGILALPRSMAAADIRLTARLQADTGLIGVVFRYVDPSHCLRFSMSRGAVNHRSLLKQAGITTTILWEDTAAYAASQPQSLRIEALGNQIVGYLDHVLLFSVLDDTPKAGRAGVYVNGNQTVDVLELQCEEIAGPLVLLQPALAEGSDIVPLPLPLELDPGSEWTVLNGSVTHSPAVSGAPRIALLGKDAYDTVRFSCRVGQNSGAPAQNSGLVFRYLDDANYLVLSLDPPLPGQGPARLVRLLKTDKSGTSEVWTKPLPSNAPATSDVTIYSNGSWMQVAVNGTIVNLWSDSSSSRKGRVGVFSAATSQVTFDHALISADVRLAGQWTLTSTNPFAPGIFLRKMSDRLTVSSPGAILLAGTSRWSDCRIAASFQSLQPSGPGLVFRFADDRNYYAAFFLLGQLFLLKVKSGVSKVLSQLPVAGSLEDGISIGVDAVGLRLRVYCNSRMLIDINDGDLQEGQAGVIYTQASDLVISGFQVTATPSAARALFHDRFASGDTSGWSLAPAGNWKTKDGSLTAALGPAFASAGSPAWTDVVVEAQLKPPVKGSLGVAFRYVDAKSHYRFVLDRGSSGFQGRLEKVINGVVTVLWNGDPVSALLLSSRNTVEISARAIGNELAVFIDGVPVCRVNDTGLSAGAVALYAGSELQEFASSSGVPGRSRMEGLADLRALHLSRSAAVANARSSADL